MKKLVLTTLALMTFAAPLAFAQNGAMNLAYSVCRTATNNGTLANNDQTSLCDDDFASAKRLVATFKNTQVVPAFQGTTIVVDVQVASPSLPAWWDFNACQGTLDNLRGGQLTNATVGTLASCTNPMAGDAAGQSGGAGIFYNVGGQARVRYEADWVRPTSSFNLVVPASVGGYTAQILTLGFAGSLDPGDGFFCDGCLLPACIVLNRVNYFGGGLQFVIDQPELRRDVTWQGGAGTNCPGSTPTQNKTWGQVKALYR